LSYTRQFLAEFGLTSCDAFRTDARIATKLETHRAVMVDCAAKYRARNPADYCDESIFSPAAFNAEFGPGATAVTAGASTL
jgi:hypothetical protein